jgi:hypothetical protein
MSPRTPTLPLDDKAMWRRLVARTHPDAGGNHDLFIWTGTVKDAVCGGQLQVESKSKPSEHPSRQQETSTDRQSAADDKPRVPWPTGTDFEGSTHEALLLAAMVQPYAQILLLLADCRPLEHLAFEQDRGASYKRLAAIAHTWGMSKAERVGWYRVAEGIPLSDRHAGHILSKLKRRAA